MNMEKLCPYVLITLIIHLLHREYRRAKQSGAALQHLGHPAGKRTVGGTAFPRRLLSVGGPCAPLTVCRHAAPLR